jgi:hypothetical protein
MANSGPGGSRNPFGLPRIPLQCNLHDLGHSGCLLSYLLILVHIVISDSGFGGLGVACWPLVLKFAGSNRAEAVGFLGRKNPQHAFLRRGSKAVGPMS